MRAGQEHLKEEIIANLKLQIGCLASHIYVNQENVDAWLEEMKARRSQEATEARLEKEKPTWKKWRLLWMSSKKS
jgi:hypothetical protein